MKTCSIVTVYYKMSICEIIYSILKFSYLDELNESKILLCAIFVSLVKDENLEVRNLTLNCVAIFKVRMLKDYEQNSNNNYVNY